MPMPCRLGWAGLGCSIPARPLSMSGGQTARIHPCSQWPNVHASSRSALIAIKLGPHNWYSTHAHKFESMSAWTGMRLLSCWADILHVSRRSVCSS